MSINSQSNNSSLSVVIPAYNEESNITRVVHEVLTISNLLEIVIVDDCSTDRTLKTALQLIKTHSQDNIKNTDKTEALKTGFVLATGDIVITQNADLEYEPAEIDGVI